MIGKFVSNPKFSSDKTWYFNTGTGKTAPKVTGIKNANHHKFLQIIEDLTKFSCHFSIHHHDDSLLLTRNQRISWGPIQGDGVCSLTDQGQRGSKTRLPILSTPTAALTGSFCFISIPPFFVRNIRTIIIILTLMF